MKNKEQYDNLKELEHYVWNERQRINKEIKAYEMYDVLLENLEHKISGIRDGVLFQMTKETFKKKD